MASLALGDSTRHLKLIGGHFLQGSTMQLCPPASSLLAGTTQRGLWIMYRLPAVHAHGLDLEERCKARLLCPDLGHPCHSRCGGGVAADTCICG